MPRLYSSHRYWVLCLLDQNSKPLTSREHQGSLDGAIDRLFRLAFLHGIEIELTKRQIFQSCAKTGKAESEEWSLLAKVIPVSIK